MLAIWYSNFGEFGDYIERFVFMLGFGYLDIFNFVFYITSLDGIFCKVKKVWFFWAFVFQFGVLFGYNLQSWVWVWLFLKWSLSNEIFKLMGLDSYLKY